MRVLRSTQNTVTPPLGWRGPCAFRQSAAHSHPASSWSCGEHRPCAQQAWRRITGTGNLLSIGIGPALGSTTRPPVPQKSFAALLVGKEPFKPGVKGGTTILGVIWYLLAVSKGHQMAGGTEDSLQLLGQGKVVLSTKQHQ